MCDERGSGSAVGVPVSALVFSQKELKALQEMAADFLGMDDQGLEGAHLAGVIT